jgi:hypothetical protein
LGCRPNGRALARSSCGQERTCTGYELGVTVSWGNGIWQVSVNPPTGIPITGMGGWRGGRRGSNHHERHGVVVVDSHENGAGMKAWFRSGRHITRHAGQTLAEATDRLTRALQDPAAPIGLESRRHGTGVSVYASSARRNGFELGLQMVFSEGDGSCMVTAYVGPHPTARVIAVLWAIIGGILALAMGVASVASVLALHRVPLELAWFIFIAAIVLVPFAQIRRGIKKGPVLARFFDSVFPGSGSIWPGEEGQLGADPPPVARG